ncbi:E2 protein [Panthera leo persica papillomavirus 1]|uniref:Regulatory protein E2 n=1 Tax=Panthera leo persica papillomavirus 1 TaxID=2772508 RepID=I6LEJ9_9PAPI|nr:E2 protein [Panthera leo persica papillomavirus 1]
MENVSKALECVQEQLLHLYEKDSAELRDQIMHWNLNRREQALYYCARKQGITRIGMNPVPTLAAAQQKAKSAIEQELLLQSLLDSKYADEPWTLMDTSRERLLVEPPYCFKKGGQQVEVRFDCDRENVSRYVLWTDIYHQTEQDQWRKTKGQADNRGLFYKDEKGVKVYYVDFEDEAKKFGKTGHYDIVSKLTTPVLTSTTGSGLGDSSTAGSATASGCPKKQTPTKARKRPLRLSSPKTSGSRFRRGGGGQRELASSSSTPRPTPPSPGEVGKAVSTVPRRSGDRLGRLLLDARDPPVLVLKGDPNSLKCTRYRLKGKYSHLFCRASTTWQWTSSTGPDRWGRSRMLLTFTDTAQRDLFEKAVKLPKSVQFFRGSFEDL